MNILIVEDNQFEMNNIVKTIIPKERRDPFLAGWVNRVAANMMEA